MERLAGAYDLIVDAVGGATFGLAIEHLATRGIVVNVATQTRDETVTFHAARFDRAPGAQITLNFPEELAVHASAASDLTRLCALMAEGRLDGQIEFETSWREPNRALDTLLGRRIGGKAVLHVDSSRPWSARCESPTVTSSKLRGDCAFACDTHLVDQE